jgi:hypothetical protein
MLMVCMMDGLTQLAKMIPEMTDFEMENQSLLKNVNVIHLLSWRRTVY